MRINAGKKILDHADAKLIEPRVCPVQWLVLQCALRCALQGYAPLYNPFDQFYSRYVYRRVRHCFNRPVCSMPHSEITLKERATDDYNWTFRYPPLNRSRVVTALAFAIAFIISFYSHAMDETL